MMNATKLWMRTGLVSAALFYASSGLLLISWPSLPLHWLGLAVAGAAVPLVRLLGIIDLSLAVGFAAASAKPCQYWPMTLAGFVVHAGVVLGFLVCASNGELPLSAWPAAAIHDAFWCLPLGAILHGVFREELKKRCVGCSEIQTFAMRTKTQYGVSLLEMSNLSPVLLIFLRQLGCTFCREALADLAAHKHEIDAQGVRIAIVHMASEDRIEPLLAQFGLAAVPRIGDSNRSLYRAFGLRRGSWPQLFGPKVWLRGLVVAPKYGFGRTIGDAAQMPGVFLVFHGEVIKSYQHQSAADKADFVSLVAQQDYPIAS
jgi:peroxiredoxin